MEKKARVEVEGDHHIWWYVCEECHTAVDPKEWQCPVCKRRLDWKEVKMESYE